VKLKNIFIFAVHSRAALFTCTCVQARVLLVNEKGHIGKHFTEFFAIKKFGDLTIDLKEEVECSRVIA